MTSPRSLSRRVAIVHPWYPAYREAFVAELHRKATKANISVDFYHGEPHPSVALRSDSIRRRNGIPLSTKFFRVGKKYFELKRLRPLLNSGDYDLVIVEQAVKNFETYRLLFLKYRRRVAFWGHGRTYTQPSGKLQERLKVWLTRQGVWFFAYTRGGASAVAASGFPSDRITVVNNSIDSRTLRDEVVQLSEGEMTAFRELHGLRDRSCVFIGGLDASKRIDFLISVGDMLYAKDADFRLLFLGDGDSRSMLEQAASSRPWIVYLGPGRGKVKALSLASSRLILMPGRVGLVAVDSFASRTPLATTNWEWHAPEFEYLKDRYNALVVDDSAFSYAKAVGECLDDPALQKLLETGCEDSFHQFSVESMADNFLRGIIGALGVARNT